MSVIQNILEYLKPFYGDGEYYKVDHIVNDTMNNHHVISDMIKEGYLEKKKGTGRFISGSGSVTFGDGTTIGGDSLPFWKEHEVRITISGSDKAHGGNLLDDKLEQWMQVGNLNTNYPHSTEVSPEESFDKALETNKSLPQESTELLSEEFLETSDSLKVVKTKVADNTTNKNEEIKSKAGYQEGGFSKYQKISMAIGIVMVLITIIKFVFNLKFDYHFF